MQTTSLRQASINAIHSLGDSFTTITSVMPPSFRNAATGVPVGHLYKAMLANGDAGGPALPNENFDVGGATIAGKYKGTDEAYAKLVGKLADYQFAGMQPDLRQNIVAFYKDLPPVSAKSTKKEKAAAAKLLDQIDRLKAVPEAVPAPQVP